LKKDIVEAPYPHEEKLLIMETKKLTFANDRAIDIRMSQWHWQMLEFLDQGDDYAQGHLKEWVEIRPDKDDRFQSDLAMMILRDDYELYRRTRFREAYADPKDKAADNRHKIT
jgi:hypothetical protein